MAISIPRPQTSFPSLRFPTLQREPRHSVATTFNYARGTDVSRRTRLHTRSFVTMIHGQVNAALESKKSFITPRSSRATRCRSTTGWSAPSKSMTNAGIRSYRKLFRTISLGAIRTIDKRTDKVQVRCARVCFLGQNRDPRRKFIAARGLPFARRFRGIIEGVGGVRCVGEQKFRKSARNRKPSPSRPVLRVAL